MQEVDTSKMGNYMEYEPEIEPYQNEEEVIEGMNLCLESVSMIRDRIQGLSFEDFLNNRAIRDVSAMRYEIIGVRMEQLDNALILNKAMETASIDGELIAHLYGTPALDLRSIWDHLKSNLDLIEEGCRKVISMIESGEVTVVEKH